MATTYFRCMLTGKHLPSAEVVRSANDSVIIDRSLPGAARVARLLVNDGDEYLNRRGPNHVNPQGKSLVYLPRRDGRHVYRVDHGSIEDWLREVDAPVANDTWERNTAAV